MYDRFSSYQDQLASTTALVSAQVIYYCLTNSEHSLDLPVVLVFDLCAEWLLRARDHLVPASDFGLSGGVGVRMRSGGVGVVGLNGLSIRTFCNSLCLGCDTISAVLELKFWSEIVDLQDDAIGLFTVCRTVEFV